MHQMENYTSVSPSQRLTNTVVTLGNFDGVHLGHQKIFHHLVQRARDLGGRSVVYTFQPHPAKVLNPTRNIPLITSYEDRAALVEAYGVDVLICAPFDKAFALQSAREFVETVLHRGLGASEILVGYDYAFGRGREGNTAFLQQMGQDLGFRVQVISPVMLGGVRVSSRMIRLAVQEGDITLANRMLGREFTVLGTVQPGHHRGKKLGYPTANIALKSELLPRGGVYAVRVLQPNIKEQLGGMANFGTNPTFGDSGFSFEVHIFDFQGDLYGQEIRVAMVNRLRDEKRFDSPLTLIEQLRIDEDKARSLLRRRAS
jgi:riboflavin kinase/FMN adenylyltransferase